VAATGGGGGGARNLCRALFGAFIQKVINRTTAFPLNKETFSLVKVVKK